MNSTCEPKSHALSLFPLDLSPRNPKLRPLPFHAGEVILIDEKWLNDHQDLVHIWPHLGMVSTWVVSTKFHKQIAATPKVEERARKKMVKKHNMAL